MTHFNLIAYAGVFVGGILAALALAVAGVFDMIDLGGTTNNYIDSGGGQVTVSSPAAEVSCPDGWENTSTQDEHTVQLSCSSDWGTVWLTAEGEFSHAWDGESPDFIFVPSGVPDWGD